MLTKLHELGIAFVLVPFCQAHLANGGIGIMFAVAGGELVMVAAACQLIREAVDRRMAVDLLRGLLGGAATVLLMRLLPPLTPVISIPACVLVFLGLSVAVGLVNRADLEILAATLFRSRSAAGAANTPA